MSKIKNILKKIDSCGCGESSNIDLNKIEEKLPADVMKSLSNKYNSNIRSSLLKVGVDIEKAEASIEQLSGARDPKLQDENRIFIFMYGDTLACITKGKALVYETYIRVKGDYVNIYSQQSWKGVIENSTTIYSIDLSKYNTKDVKAQRKDAKSGKVDRNPGQRGTDKSGYVLNKDKYKNLLLTKIAKDNDFESVINNAISIIKNGKNINFDKVSLDTDYKVLREFNNNFSEYASSTRYIMSALADLIESINSEKEYGDNPAESRRVLSYINRAREYTKEAKKYLDKLK